MLPAKRSFVERAVTTSHIHPWNAWREKSSARKTKKKVMFWKIEQKANNLEKNSIEFRRKIEFQEL